jgi:putative membrane protein
MDGLMHPMNWPGFPYYGFGMIFWWIIFLAIGFLVYQDANKKGMNGLLWFILVVLPVVGVIFLLLYVVIRESHESSETERDKVLNILKERYAKGEITREEYLRMKEDLEKF